MKRWMLLSMLSLILPTLSEAVESTGWWHVRMVQRCERVEADGGPAVTMQDMKALGISFQMKDIEEQGKVVETTMITPSLASLGVPSLTWYRTRERCEAAMQKQREAEEPARRQREQERTRLQEHYR